MPILFMPHGTLGLMDLFNLSLLASCFVWQMHVSCIPTFEERKP